MSRGEWLRALRKRLGLTVRQVEEYSRRLAAAEDNPALVISDAWLIKLEKHGVVPNLYAVYALSVIYGVNEDDIKQRYGIHAKRKGRAKLDATRERTQLCELDVLDALVESLAIPTGVGRSDRTQFLPSRPARLRRPTDRPPPATRDRMLVGGYIGTTDFTMYPQLFPGACVTVSRRHRTIEAQRGRRQWERPIYFVELRDGCVCSYCERVDEDTLALIPHPDSGCLPRYVPCADATIIGQVVRVVMSLSLPKPAAFAQHAG